MIVTRCIDQIWESFHAACQVSIFLLANSHTDLSWSLCWSFTCRQRHFIHAYILGNKLILWPFHPLNRCHFSATPRGSRCHCVYYLTYRSQIITLKVCLNSTRPRNKTGPSCKFKREHFELHTDTKTCSKVSLIQTVVTGNRGE